mmetsp:Transcript_37407/g.117810  ORF Transcript_37407/g.117810 Transcript_37407/m.117810 type:complete len:290 (+) Transcript_37407:602-1471(+)
MYTNIIMERVDMIHPSLDRTFLRFSWRASCLRACESCFTCSCAVMSRTSDRAGSWWLMSSWRSFAARITLLTASMPPNITFLRPCAVLAFLLAMAAPARPTPCFATLSACRFFVSADRASDAGPRPRETPPPSPPPPGARGANHPPTPENGPAVARSLTSKSMLTPRGSTAISLKSVLPDHVRKSFGMCHRRRGSGSWDSKSPFPAGCALAVPSASSTSTGSRPPHVRHCPTGSSQRSSSAAAGHMEVVGSPSRLAPSMTAPANSPSPSAVAPSAETLRDDASPLRSAA